MLKKSVAWLLVFLVGVLGVIPPNVFVNQRYVNAIVENCASEGTDEWRYIWQGDPRWGDNIAVQDASFTVGNAGCYMCSVIMLMAYDNPELRDWDVFNPYILTKPTPKMTMSYSYAGWAEDGLPGDPDFVKVDSVNDLPSSSEERAKAIKSYIEDGYYVIVHINYPHYVAVTGWNGDLNKPIIQDPGGPTYDGRKYNAETRWDEIQSSFVGLEIYKGMRRADETLIGYSSDFSASKVKRKVSDNIYEINGTFYMEESDLKGLEEIRDYLVQNQIEIPVPTVETLTYSEQERLVKLRTQINNDGRSWGEWLRLIITVMGIILILYGVILSLAYLYDISDALHLISLVTLFTFNTIKIEDVREGFRDTTDGYKFMSRSQFIITLMVMFVLGILFSSGIIWYIVA